MRITIEFETHEHQDVKEYLKAVDEADVLSEFRNRVKSILKHSNDEEEVRHAEWAFNKLCEWSD